MSRCPAAPITLRLTLRSPHELEIRRGPQERSDYHYTSSPPEKKNLLYAPPHELEIRRGPQERSDYRYTSSPPEKS